MKTMTALTLALTSTQALAHAGAHTGSLLATVTHWFSQPDHLLMSGAAIACTAVIVHRIKAQA